MRWDFLPAYSPIIWESTVLTIVLSLTSFSLGLGLAFLIALGRVLGGRDANRILGTLVDFVRGIPLLVQLLIVYLGTNALGLRLNPFVAAVAGLSLYAAVFISEILRGAIRAVHSGQRDGALAIGLTPRQSVIGIELPQALPAIVPALIGFLISLVKGTSLAYVLGLFELMRTGKLIADSVFRPLETYVFIALAYFLLCFPLSKIADRVNRRLGRSGLVQERLVI